MAAVGAKRLQPAGEGRKVKIGTVSLNVLDIQSPLCIGYSRIHYACISHA